MSRNNSRNNSSDTSRNTSRNNYDEWRRRSLAAVWHPCTQMKLHQRPEAPQPLVPVSRAEGVWLHYFDGRRYLY